MNYQKKPIEYSAYSADEYGAFSADLHGETESSRSEQRRSQCSHSSKGSYSFLDEAFSDDSKSSMDSMELRAQDAEVANSIRRESFARAREIVDNNELFRQFKAGMLQSGQKINSVAHFRTALIGHNQVRAKADQVQQKSAASRGKNKPTRSGSAAALKEMFATALSLEDEEDVRPTRSKHARQMKKLQKRASLSYNLAPKADTSCLSKSDAPKYVYQEGPSVVDVPSAAGEALRSVWPNPLKRLSMAMINTEKRQTLMPLEGGIHQESKLIRDFHSSFPCGAMSDFTSELIGNNARPVGRTSSISTAETSNELLAARRTSSIGSSGTTSLTHHRSSIESTASASTRRNSSIGPTTLASFASNRRSSSIMSSLRAESLCFDEESINDGSFAQSDHIEYKQPSKVPPETSSDDHRKQQSSTDSTADQANLQESKDGKRVTDEMPRLVSLLGLEQEVVSTSASSVSVVAAVSASQNNKTNESLQIDLHTSTGREGISTSLNTIQSESSEEQTSSSSALQSSTRSGERLTHGHSSPEEGRCGPFRRSSMTPCAA
eukprot:CAMPEP_0181020140 /NCGR_PEP_ID=MMETSP1070-20121207/288_1 /TAXON_ID=265543 /ORGANISM="Minutocellus polymorphus, Strain NH13" /LENGTH=550 /DNA_ID=CAMNT_0023096927 /DNA_START=273 /DNA_END=1926 /DNA_ORIENTATION=+